jgi:hypothetical protein
MQEGNRPKNRILFLLVKESGEMTDIDAQPIRETEPIPCLYMEAVPVSKRYACGFTGELCGRVNEFWNCDIYKFQNLLHLSCRLYIIHF